MDFSTLDAHYKELIRDVYPQPPDRWHLAEMERVVKEWIVPLGIQFVLDVGCGEGEVQDIFSAFGMSYLGIALGDDVINAVIKGRNVIEQDFNFLVDQRNGSFDLLFSRHSLEHSPFPILTLMEWHRVSSKWLCLVLPNPKYHTYIGRNHYCVVDAPQAAWYLRRAGWKIHKAHINEKEYWFLAEKMPRIGPDGWAESPVDHAIYAFERDLLSLDIDVTRIFGSVK